MDITTGTFPLFSTIRNSFVFFIQLYATNTLKQVASEIYVQKFVAFTYVHSAECPTKYFANLYIIKEWLDWIAIYPMSYQSLFDWEITGI